MQCTNQLFLIRPSNFVFNSQTANSNAFQNNVVSDKTGNKLAPFLPEFDAFADGLVKNGVNVLIFQDTKTPKKPDAIFPNNWISTHSDGTVVLYPMMAANRRLERRQDIIEMLKEKFEIKRIIDLSESEKNNQFLEGTGSIVFDHANKIAYACLSPRTDKDLFVSLCDTLNYKPIYFNAVDGNGKPIYHTNVMMSIGEKFSVVCAESIPDPEEREKVIANLKTVGHEIIFVSTAQMSQFAGNMLCVKTITNNPILVLSQTAFNSLSKKQKIELNTFAELLPLQVPTIEAIGGGSVRCMMAEVFLPLKSGT